MEDTLKPLARDLQELKTALVDLSLPLRTLALSHLAERRPPAVRERFRQALQDQESRIRAARQLLQSAREGDSRSWEAFVAEESQEVVEATQLRIKQLMEDLQAEQQKANDLVQSEPVLFALLQAERRLCVMKEQ
ncbi:hypothetical protein D3C76_813910 [compost metagenome]